jgi:hypothetical protein
MQSFPALLAYFGPEVQLPLMSIVAAVVGFLLTIGRAPFGVISRWLATQKAKGKTS